MTQKLEIIGEASLEVGSSLANQSSFQSKILCSNQQDEENSYEQGFRTANNSLIADHSNPKLHSDPTGLMIHQLKT
jgi:hypothetical protein